MENIIKFNQLFKPMDDMHYNVRSIDGLNRFWNFIVTPRNDGKSTEILLKKCFKAFYEKGRCSIFFRRFGTEITEEYIESQIGILNKFLKDEYQITDYKYSGTGKNTGSVDLLINGQLFIRFLAINQKTSKLKSMFIKGLKYCFMDEFIINIRAGEKYLPNEAFKVKEIINTYWREANDLKVYFCGNPYSLFNVYFSELNIEASKLKKGAITYGKDWVVDRHDLDPRLKQWLREHNPLYNEEDEYSQYALDGETVNDTNIRVLKQQPKNFNLLYVLRFDNKYIGVYRNNGNDIDISYWCGFIDDIGTRRKAFCFDLKDLMSNAILYSKEDKVRLYSLCVAIRQYQVAFQSIEVDYLVEEIYNII